MYMYIYQCRIVFYRKLFWIANTRNESTIFVGNLDGDSESIKILTIRQKLPNPIRIYHDVKYEL